MKNIIFLFLILSSFCERSRAQSVGFEYTNSSSQLQQSELIIENSAHHYLMAGLTTPYYGSKAYGMKLIELDASGNLLQEKSFIKPNNALGLLGIFERPNEYLGIGGMTRADSDSNFLWIAHFSKTLDLLKDTTIYISQSEQGFGQCTVFRDTIFLGATVFQWASTDQLLPFSAKISMDGELIALKKYSGVLDFVNKMYVPNDTSKFFILHGEELRKVDKSFNLTGQTLRFASPLPYLNAQGDIKYLSDTTFLLTGKYWTTDSDDDQDIGVAMCSTNFNVLKIKKFGKGKDTADMPAALKSIDYTDKNKIFIGGTLDVSISLPTNANRPSAFVLVQYDSTLQQRWMKTYGNDAYYFMLGLLATSDGGCLMYGVKCDYQNNAGADLYVLKVNEQGNVTGTFATPFVQTLNIYPNPAHETVWIELPSKMPTKCILDIYAANGQKVFATEVSEGQKLLQVNVSDWTQGIYFYTLQSSIGGITHSGKIIVR